MGVPPRATAGSTARPCSTTSASSGVSNSILDKPGKLDEREWVEMRDHAVHTQAILGRIGVLADIAPIAAAHHEKLDGTGYPLGLHDHQIRRETRIITVCDFYDALTSDRPYRAAMSARSDGDHRRRSRHRDRRRLLRGVAVDHLATRALLLRRSGILGIRSEPAWSALSRSREWSGPAMNRGVWEVGFFAHSPLCESPLSCCYTMVHNGSFPL